MCIRDRARTAEHCFMPVTVGGGVRRIEDIRKLLLAGADKAVSYTHLRAHETVLDLVCRLLLEKKKTTEKSTT